MKKWKRSVLKEIAQVHNGLVAENASRKEICEELHRRGYRNAQGTEIFENTVTNLRGTFPKLFASTSGDANERDESPAPAVEYVSMAKAHMPIESADAETEKLNADLALIELIIQDRSRPRKMVVEMIRTITRGGK